jgi:SAM-dependent methyltransferase
MAADEGERAAELEAAWAAFGAAPDDARARMRLVELLNRAPAVIAAGREADLHALLVDPAVNPRLVVRAGWEALRKARRIPAQAQALAAWVEAEPLAQDLLRESFVSQLWVETLLTGMRRWLLLSGESPRFPRTVAALARQAEHNDGAWLFEADERARLAADRAAPIAAAYFPPRPGPGAGTAYAADATNRVAAQYAAWPYPSWERVTRPAPLARPEVVARLGPGAPRGMPLAAEILVAGCGTGMDAAIWASRFPDARVTAIDISATSLDYAAERCARLGLANITFRRLDLVDAASLGIAFDFVASGGVLHHTADPERAWAALVAALRPGGVMHLMVYSKLARLFGVAPARQAVADLLERPVDDELLRAIRARLIREMPGRIPRSVDFFTLAGVHDLLAHRHEDPFDVARIRACIARLGLDFLGFDLPSGADRRRYRAAHPEDRWFRDYAAWAAFERADPLLFAGMYGFWCARPEA